MSREVPVVLNASAGEPILGAHVYSARQQFLFTVRLARLFGSELDLNGGRFTSFSPQVQENRILVRRHGLTGGELMHWFAGAFDWIGEHADGAWSLAVSMADVSSGTYEFSFTSVSACVAFALLFQ